MNEVQQKQLEYLVEDVAKGRIDGITIVGYASNLGTEEKNKDLSRRRAENAKNSLITMIKKINPDFDESKVTIDYEGAPDAEKSETDEPEQRRVEIRGNYE